MTATICEQELAFHAALDEYSCNWGMRLVYTDWLEEQGRCDEAACQRWMVENRKAPCRSGLRGEYRWYSHYPADIFPEHILPNRFHPWFACINNYICRVDAEEYLMRALKALGEI